MTTTSAEAIMSLIEPNTEVPKSQVKMYEKYDFFTTIGLIEKTLVEAERRYLDRADEDMPLPLHLYDMQAKVREIRSERSYPESMYQLRGNV